MSPLLVGIGSPAVGAVERDSVSGVSTHATSGSVVEPVQGPGESLSLLDVLMRERGVTVTANCIDRTDRQSTRTRVGDAARLEGDEAVLQSVRGMFRMWRMLRGTTRGGSISDSNNVTDTEWDVESTNEVGEKREFLSLVVRALVDL